MKKYIYLFLILAATTLFLSCKKCCIVNNRYEHIGDNTFDMAVTRVFGAGWVGTLTDTVKNDTITIYGKREYDAIKLKFYLAADLPFGYQQKKFEAFYYINNYHSPATPYSIDSTANNELILSRSGAADIINSGTPWLTGHFKLTFKLSKPTGNISTDTTRIYFSNGNFDLRLHN